MITYILELSVLIFLIFLATITVASEVSIISSNKMKLKRLAMDGSRPARIVLGILESPARFFSTIFLSNNIIETFITVMVTAMVMRFMGGESRFALIVAALLAAFFIILPESIAKSIAERYSIRVASFLVFPVRWLIRVLYPVVRVIEYIINSIIRLLGLKGASRSSVVTDDAIKSMIKVGQAEGSLQKDKYIIISRIFDFSEAMVRSVMTPKADIAAVDLSADPDEIIDKVLECGYSRVPVYKGSPENIIGIINMKDVLMLSHNKDLVVLQDIIYPATMVDETRKVTELLKEFQKGHTHIALVVDGRKQLLGIVTLEDLIEEIVGEIEDESDIRATNYKMKNI